MLKNSTAHRVFFIISLCSIYFSAHDLFAIERSITFSPDGSVKTVAGPLQNLPTPRQEKINPVVDINPSGGALGKWRVWTGAVKPGYQGKASIAIKNASYSVDASTDLLLHFDQKTLSDATGRWEIGKASKYAISSHGLLGSGAGYFTDPGSVLELIPKKDALLAGGSRFRDFSIEFWLYPSFIENGEQVLFWDSLRNLGSGLLPQSFTCMVHNGHLVWQFQNFFEKPSRAANTIAASKTTITLHGQQVLQPRRWSHHLIRYDGDTGLFEYLIDGEIQESRYLTDTGREGGTVLVPIIAARASLSVAPSFDGLIDELRISRRFVDDQQLQPYSSDVSTVLSPIIDLGYTASLPTKILAHYSKAGSSDISFSYRLADDYVQLENADSGNWINFAPGQKLPQANRGRFLQVRANLYADGGGKFSPQLDSYTVYFVPEIIPAPPAWLTARADGSTINLNWAAVPAPELTGYRIYYGDKPGDYRGTDLAEGASPIIVGKDTHFSFKNVPLGKLHYFVITSYTGDANPTTIEAQTSHFSQEVSARPTYIKPESP